MGDGIVTIFSKENFILGVIPFLLLVCFLFCFQNESYPLATVDFFSGKMFMIGIMALKLKPLCGALHILRLFFPSCVLCIDSSSSLQKVCKFSVGHLM